MSMAYSEKSAMPLPRAAAARRQRMNNIITCVSLALGLVGAFLIWQRRPQNALPKRSQTAPVSAMAFLGPVPSGLSGGASGLAFRGGRRGGPFLPQPIPRYIANLTDRVGEYVVSARHVLGEGSPQSLYTTQAEPAEWGTMSRVLLSIQVMSTTPKAMERVKDFAAELVAIDETGRRITTEKAQPVIRFEEGEGQARVVQLRAPAPNARYLRAVEGEILLDAPGEPRLKFRLDNVPLPVRNHVFGDVSATLLDRPPISQVSGETPTFRQLVGPDLAALESRFPVHTPEFAPLEVRNRLILAPDLPHEFQLILPDAPGLPPKPALRCRLTARPDSVGEIEFTLAVQEANSSEKPLQVTTQAWENEPMALFLPARRLFPKAPADRWVGLRLCLVQDAPSAEREPLLYPLKPFPVKSKERGGVLAGQVSVGRQPLSLARVDMEITPIDRAGEAPSPARIKLALDQEGRWRFVSMSPGRYRVRLLDVEPYRSSITRPIAWPEYLRRRFGMEKPDWENATQTVTVRPGGFTELKPWNATDRGKAARRAYSSSDA